MRVTTEYDGTKCPRCNEILHFSTILVEGEFGILSDCCGSGIDELRQDWGLDDKPTTIGNIDKERLEALRIFGYNPQEIAIFFNCTNEQVQDAMRQMGVQ